MYFQEDLKEVFDMLVVVVFPQWRFSFLGYFSMLPAFRAGIPDPWRSPPALFTTLATLFGYFSRLFLSVVCPIQLRTLQVWANVFYPQAFFTFHFFPNFDAFVIQMQAGTLLHPKSFFMFAIIKLPLSASTWPWTTNDIRLLSNNQPSSIK